MSCPNRRRWRRRVRSTGPHRVSTTGRSSSTPTMARSSSTPVGERDWMLMNVETAATAPQNAWAPAGPSKPPLGSVGLARRAPSIHVNGSLQTVLVLGPDGPLLNPRSFCPQCPLYVSHGNGSLREGFVGTSTGLGRNVRNGRVALSQPRPEPPDPVSRKVASS